VSCGPLVPSSVQGQPPILLLDLAWDLHSMRDGATRHCCGLFVDVELSNPMEAAGFALSGAESTAYKKGLEGQKLRARPKPRGSEQSSRLAGQV
jgi:hypothetical protein